MAAGAQHPPRRGGPIRWRRLRLAVGLAVVVLAGVSFVVAVGRRSDSDAAESSDSPVAVDPGAFASGACVAMPPTRGHNGHTVFLDAGHGGVDPGAVGTATDGATVDEADETLPVELDAADRLRQAGYRVVVSRTTDSSVARLTPADLSGSVLSLQGAHDDVVARVQCADLAGAQVLVGIYFDSGGSADDAGSLTTYDADRPFAADNLRLADLVQQDVMTAMNDQGWGIPDAGVTPDSQEGSLVPTSSDSPLAAEAASYGHLLLLGPAAPGYLDTPTSMPGAVIEPLFVTDPFEATIASSTQGQGVIAGGIAAAVEQYFPPPISHGRPGSTTTTTH